MADHQLPKPSSPEEATTASSEGADGRYKLFGEGGVAAENPTAQESKKQLEFSGDEETLIIRMYNLVGERWSLIAGRIPGRSAEEIEEYWNSRHSTNERQPEKRATFPNIE